MVRDDVISNASPGNSAVLDSPSSRRNDATKSQEDTDYLEEGSQGRDVNPAPYKRGKKLVVYDDDDEVDEPENQKKRGHNNMNKRGAAAEEEEED